MALVYQKESLTIMRDCFFAECIEIHLGDNLVVLCHLPRIAEDGCYFFP